MLYTSWFDNMSLQDWSKRDRGERERWENKNNGASTGLLKERSELSMSVLASLLSLTFVYCELKTAANSWIMCMYCKPAALDRIMWHTWAPLVVFILPSWMEALPASVTPGFTLRRHLFFFFLFFPVPLLSLLHSVILTSALLISSAGSLASPNCPRQKGPSWPFAVSSSGLGVCEWPCPDTKSSMSTPEWH